MDFIVWLLYLGIGSWLVLGGLFFMYPTVYRLKDQKDQFGPITKIPLYLWLFIGLIADIVFNATWGTVIFRELPHEFLFTDRLKRHHYGDDRKQFERAERWVWRVNMVDPGHV